MIAIINTGIVILIVGLPFVRFVDVVDLSLYIFENFILHWAHFLVPPEHAGILRTKHIKPQKLPF
jgi:hypothetical protein